jgi:large subunit ribosomal protein L32
MAVPRNRMSNARKNSKRAHHAKQPKQSTPCSNCGAARLSHRLCPSCGYYNNRSIVKTEEKEV